MELSALTTHDQVTVAKVVRDALGLRQADQLCWELQDGSVRVGVVDLLDVACLRPVWCVSSCSPWMSAWCSAGWVCWLRLIALLWPPNWPRCSPRPPSLS